MYLINTFSQFIFFFLCLVLICLVPISQTVLRTWSFSNMRFHSIWHHGGVWKTLNYNGVRAEEIV